MADNEENIDLVDGSEGEIKSISARKRKVKETLSSLGINVKENCDPPVIAVLGSGGGVRATVGFLGTISKLAELNLLGAVTYIAGTSGSTWCMSSLYLKKNWSDFSEMEKLEKQLRERMKWETTRKYPLEKIKEAFLGDSYSLTDFWAYTFVYYALNTINEGKLSSHKEMCETGEDPYPIYSAVRKHQIHDNKPEAWFEFTPHKSGFPAHKSYVMTEHLGSKFKGGHLLEEKPEYDLMYLQALWGSAPGADWVSLYLHDTFKNLFKRPARDTIKKLKRPAQDESHETLIQDIKQDESYEMLMQEIEEDDLTETLSPELDEETMEAAEINTFSLDNLRVITNIGSCLWNWKWGATNNFLYQCKAKIPEDSKLFHKEHFHLVDSGLEINTPYPLVLPPHRKVDLILSFDFSQGDPFETVKRTVEYCKENKIPFPEIPEESYENTPTKSCYVFGGDGNETPDVMHFPLFNTQTCGDAVKIEMLGKKYDTHVLSYDDSMMEELLDIAKKNVKSSLDQIRDQIQLVQRCN